MSPARIADYWVKLMTENLGYERFVAQGGDWGASVTARLGFACPEQVAGIHVTAVSSAAMTPDLADVLMVVGALAAAVLTYLLASRIVPLVNMWGSKEGLLLQRVRPLVKTELKVLAKPD